MGDVVHYSEGVLVGYRWYDQRRIRPAFPFGHGLSYTSFEFGRLRVQPRTGDRRARSVDVVNTGRRTGVAVPQLYLGLPGAPGRVQPPRQLKGFESRDAAAGPPGPRAFRLDARAFSYWNAAATAGRSLPAATACCSAVVPRHRRPRDDRGARRALRRLVHARSRARPPHVAKQAHPHDLAVAELGELSEATRATAAPLPAPVPEALRHGEHPARASMCSGTPRSRGTCPRSPPPTRPRSRLTPSWPR